MIIKNINMIDLEKILAVTIYPEASEGFIKNMRSIPITAETALIAMREACEETVEACAKAQAEKYAELGYTNTGKAIEQQILTVKQQIKP